MKQGMRKFSIILPLLIAAVIARPLLATDASQPAKATQQGKPGIISSLTSLSHDEAVQGLKAALTNGVQAAIRDLGHDGGFLTNLAVRIPLPAQLQGIERALRAVHEDKLADEFVASMNHAAEKAVPQAVSVFAEAISHMTIGDAESILTGPSDAATQYFRRTTQTNLFARFEPIVKKATDETGVTSAYKRVLDFGVRNKYLGALLGAVSEQQSLDLDAYITNKAMDGLFEVIADEEQRIRQDPVARTTDLLKKVFGSLGKPGTSL